MQQKIVSIRDSAADSFMRPFTVPTVGMAIRAFTDEVNRVSPDNQMNVHPSDFELFEIGEFDEQTGMVCSIPPRSISRAIDVKTS